MIQAAGFILFCGEGDRRKYLLLKNALFHEWGFPKGHLESGENLIEGALRELKEETGLERVTPRGFQEALSYPVEGRMKEVTYYLASVDQEGEISLSSEHEEYRWVTWEEVLELIPHSNLKSLFQRAKDF